MNGIDRAKEAARPRRKRMFWRFHGLAPQIASEFQSSPHDTRFSLAASRSRSASARRKARLIRRREVNQVLKLFAAFKREEGQTMAEYGVVLAVITIAVFGALALLSGNIVNALTRVAGYIT
jgi:Flp pilus assembly pilin Flp